MREFHAFEYVDGDIKVYVKYKDETDAGWEEIGLVLVSERHRSVVDLAEHLGLENMDGAELTRLHAELADPRRW